MFFCKRLFQLFFSIVFITHAACAQNSKEITLKDSTVIHLADPTVFHFKDSFYLYGTVEENAKNGFLVFVSSDLENWKLSSRNMGYALKKGDAFGTHGFWAPQVFFYRNKFYMAYVANEEIAIAESNSPLGPFQQSVKKSLDAPVKQIDPYIFIDDDGKIYLYHVRLNQGNRIFVAQMTDDLSAILPGTLKECITATESWENTAQAEWPVAEGPTVVKHKSNYYLVYTANDFRNPDYAVGYATSKTPLGPWKKFEANPILVKNKVGYNGTGHGDLFRSKKNLFYIFHTHQSDAKVGPRKTALIKMQFVKDPVTGMEQLKLKPGSFRFLKRQMN